jgi:hypothetical protein
MRHCTDTRGTGLAGGGLDEGAHDACGAHARCESESDRLPMQFLLWRLIAGKVLDAAPSWHADIRLLERRLAPPTQGILCDEKGTGHHLCFGEP